MHHFHILKTVRIFLNSGTLGFTVILVISERVTLSSSFPKALEHFYFTFFSLQKNKVNANLEFLFKGLSFNIMNFYKLMAYLEEDKVKKNNHN